MGHSHRVVEQSLMDRLSPGVTSGIRKEYEEKY